MKKQDQQTTESAMGDVIAPKLATVHMESMSPYSQSRPILDTRRANENGSAFEEKVWRQRLHITDDGHIFIPPMAVKNCLSEAAKFLSMSVPGKGKATYTKHFEAGVMASDPIILDVMASDVQAEDLYLPSDGKRGGGKRVWKKYPLIQRWSGDAKLVVLDETITRDALARHLHAAGLFIGIGRFRPRNNGFYGRFRAEIVEWTDIV